MKKCLFIVLLLCGTANAGLIHSNVAGNDSEESVSLLLGKKVEETGKFDDITFFDGGVIWEESGSAIPNDLFLTSTSTGQLIQGIDYDFFAVKAGDYYNVYEAGIETSWVTPFNKAVSHVTLYRCPEPSGLLLALFGLIPFWRFR